MNALWILLVTLCLMGQLSMAHATVLSQPNGGATVTDDRGTRRPVVATIASDQKNRVGDPIFVTITLANTSSSVQIVKNMVAYLDTTADTRIGAASQCTLGGMGEVSLPPGENYTQTCRFAPGGEDENFASDQSVPKVGRERRFGVLDRLFSADVRLVVDVDVEGIGSQRFYPVVTINASDTSVFIGGVVGAMLLALFVLAERLIRNSEALDKLAHTALVTLLLGMRGGLLAVIALLLGRTTQGVGSPVTLTVADFSGGVLIGLFSYPIATWISSTLRLDQALSAVAAKSDSTRSS